MQKVKDLKSIDNNIYGIIRMILEDKLEGKDDYNLSYEVTNKGEEISRRECSRNCVRG